MRAQQNAPDAEGRWLGANRKHAVRCTRRWLARRHRDSEALGAPVQWAVEQCGACQYWVPVVGLLSADFGACGNAASPWDGTIRYIHDGCDRFSAIAAADDEL